MKHSCYANKGKLLAVSMGPSPRSIVLSTIFDVKTKLVIDTDTS